MKLVGAVVGGIAQAPHFTVDVPGHNLVGDLMKLIKAELQYAGPAGDLKLFVTKHNDTWLQADSAGGQLVLKGGFPVEIYEFMKEYVSASNRVEVLFANAPTENVIHMLVGKVGTIHRHPMRTKRWSAINAMARQKNSTTRQSADKSKQRHNDLLDSAEASISKADIDAIYQYQLQPVRCGLQHYHVSKTHITQLQTRMNELRDMYGVVRDGNEKSAKRLFFIAAVLETVCHVLDGFQILVEEDVTGKNVHVHGRFAFVLKRESKKIAIVNVIQQEEEAIEQGVAQSLMGLEALADVEVLDKAFGIVTSYRAWRFLMCGNETIQEEFLSIQTVDSKQEMKDLKTIVQKICRMLS